MHVMLSDSFERLLESLIDGIVAFREYFVIGKKMSLSETTMFLFSLSWMIWFVVVQGHVSDVVLARSVWMTLFILTTAAHFISFLFHDIIVRAYVSAVNAVIWLCLTVLSYSAGSVAPAVPTLAVFTFLSVMIAVRLFRERRAQ
jgi:hypothetical protein